jgi:hypothetical protein
MLSLFLASALCAAPRLSTSPTQPAPVPPPIVENTVRAPGGFPAAALAALADHAGQIPGRIGLALKGDDTGNLRSVLAVSAARATVEFGRLRGGGALRSGYFSRGGATPSPDLPRLPSTDLDSAARTWTAVFGYPDEVIAAVRETDLVSVWRLTSAAQDERECLRLAEAFSILSQGYSPPPALHDQTDASIQYDSPASLRLALPTISRLLEDTWLVNRFGKADIVWFGVNSTGMEMRWTAFATRYVVCRFAIQYGTSARTFCDIAPTRVNMVTDLGNHSATLVIESNEPMNLDQKSLRAWLAGIR